jgi:hypothetical protein
MNLIAVVIGWELGTLSKAFEMIFPFLLAVIVCAIFVYLLFFVLVSKRLFQAFWASIEDEE